MITKFLLLFLTFSLLIGLSHSKVVSENSLKNTTSTVTTTKPNERTIDEIEEIIQQNLKKLVSIAKVKVIPPYENFVGTWELDSSENYDKFLDKLNVSWIQRKVLTSSKPTLIITHDSNDQWSLSTKSTLKTTKTIFFIGKPFEDESYDGRKVQTTFTFSGSKLIQTLRDPKTNKSVCEVHREVDNSNGNLVTRFIIDDVTATRIFHRKN